MQKSSLYFYFDHSLSGPCHSAKLVCLVFTNEKTWAKSKVPLLQIQLSQGASECKQHGNECSAWAPVQQWQHNL